MARMELIPKCPAHPRQAETLLRFGAMRFLRVARGIASSGGRLTTFGFTRDRRLAYDGVITGWRLSCFGALVGGDSTIGADMMRLRPSWDRRLASRCRPCPVVGFGVAVRYRVVMPESRGYTCRIGGHVLASLSWKSH